MENFQGLTVKTKKVIYLGEKQLIPDLFDNVANFEDFIIAYCDDYLIIINPIGQIILSEKNVIITQIHKGYISLRKNNLMGVYRYDGKLVVPFEFYRAIIFYDGVIEVQKNEGDPWKSYDL